MLGWVRHCQLLQKKKSKKKKGDCAQKPQVSLDVKLAARDAVLKKKYVVVQRDGDGESNKSDKSNSAAPPHHQQEEPPIPHPDELRRRRELEKAEKQLPRAAQVRRKRKRDLMREIQEENEINNRSLHQQTKESSSHKKQKKSRSSTASTSTCSRNKESPSSVAAADAATGRRQDEGAAKKLPQSSRCTSNKRKQRETPKDSQPLTIDTSATGPRNSRKNPPLVTPDAETGTAAGGVAAEQPRKQKKKSHDQQRAGASTRRVTPSSASATHPKKRSNKTAQQPSQGKPPVEAAARKQPVQGEPPAKVVQQRQEKSAADSRPASAQKPREEQEASTSQEDVVAKEINVETARKSQKRPATAKGDNDNDNNNSAKPSNVVAAASHRPQKIASANAQLAQKDNKIVEEVELEESEVIFVSESKAKSAAWNYVDAERIQMIEIVGDEDDDGEGILEVSPTTSTAEESPGRAATVSPPTREEKDDEVMPDSSGSRDNDKEATTQSGTDTAKSPAHVAARVSLEPSSDHVEMIDLCDTTDDEAEGEPLSRQEEQSLEVDLCDTTDDEAEGEPLSRQDEQPLEVDLCDTTDDEAEGEQRDRQDEQSLEGSASMETEQPEGAPGKSAEHSDPELEGEPLKNEKPGHQDEQTLEEHNSIETERHGDSPCKHVHDSDGSVSDKENHSAGINPDYDESSESKETDKSSDDIRVESESVEITAGQTEDSQLDDEEVDRPITQDVSACPLNGDKGDMKLPTEDDHESFHSPTGGISSEEDQSFYSPTGDMSPEKDRQILRSHAIRNVSSEEENHSVRSPTRDVPSEDSDEANQSCSSLKSQQSPQSNETHTTEKTELRVNVPFLSSVCGKLSAMRIDEGENGCEEELDEQNEVTTDATNKSIENDSDVLTVDDRHRRSPSDEMNVAVEREDTDDSNQAEVEERAGMTAGKSTSSKQSQSERPPNGQTSESVRKPAADRMHIESSIETSAEGDNDASAKAVDVSRAGIGKVVTSPEATDDTLGNASAQPEDDDEITELMESEPAKSMEKPGETGETAEDDGAESTEGSLSFDEEQEEVTLTSTAKSPSATIDTDSHSACSARTGPQTVAEDSSERVVDRTPLRTTEAQSFGTPESQVVPSPIVFRSPQMKMCHEICYEYPEIDEADIVGNGSQRGYSPFKLTQYNDMWKQVENDIIGYEAEVIEESRDFCAANQSIKISNPTQGKAQYGRFKTEALDKLLKVAGLKKHHVFADFGHGIGNTCLQAAYTIGCRAKGIELIEQRYLVSNAFRKGLAMVAKQENSANRKKHAAGKVELRKGTLADPSHLQWLTEDIDVAFVNNYNGVFAERSECKPGENGVDDYVAGLFSRMKVGSVMLTLHKLRMGVPRDVANEQRKSRGFEESINASFFVMEEIELLRKSEACTWFQACNNQMLIVYKYTRVEQDEESAVMLCSVPACAYAQNSIPIPATEGNSIIITGCPGGCGLPRATRRKKYNYKL